MFHHEDWYYHDLYDGDTIETAKNIKDSNEREYYMYMRWLNRSNKIFKLKYAIADRTKHLNEQPSLPRISCLYCGRPMYFKKSIELDSKALFFFECGLGHLPKRAFYSNGLEYQGEEARCEKCGGESLTTKTLRTTDGSVVTETCRSCSNVKKYIAKLEVKPVVTDLERRKYCYTDAEARATQTHFWYTFWNEMIEVLAIVSSDTKAFKKIMRRKD